LQNVVLWWRSFWIYDPHTLWKGSIHHSTVVHIQLGFKKVCSFLRKLCIHLPIGFNFKAFSCGEGPLGCISTKNINFVKDHPAIYRLGLFKLEY
jgi:hypothetical protein